MGRFLLVKCVFPSFHYKIERGRHVNFPMGRKAGSFVSCIDENERPRLFQAFRSEFTPLYKAVWPPNFVTFRIYEKSRETIHQITPFHMSVYGKPYTCMLSLRE